MWAFVVIMITLILAGIVFSLLYSVTFVTQPIKSMAPIDQAYTKMLNDIVLLIVGGIGGIVGKRVASSVSNAISPTPPSGNGACGNRNCYTSSTYVPSSIVPGPTSNGQGMPDWDWMGYKNPELDESWVPPPPPTTPPEFLESDDVREEIALARDAGKDEE